ncbi:MAG: hypothetical protein KAJ13_02100 [Gemmatimonadetes bacterium]|nr:hypothetical protein [Gemmatimonadota bacterium]
MSEGGAGLAGALQFTIHGAPYHTVSDDPVEVLGIPVANLLDGVSHFVRKPQHQFYRSGI